MTEEDSKKMNELFEELLDYIDKIKTEVNQNILSNKESTNQKNNKIKKDFKRKETKSLQPLLTHKLLKYLEDSHSFKEKLILLDEKQALD